MAFTEFYCDNSTGSNLNGGAPIGGVYPITYASGSWVAATGVFTVASGDPSVDGVTVGDFASVYADGASAPTGFVGRVTARDATTITVSLTAASGTAPTDGTNTRTIKIGGAWKGPNAGSGFPLSFVTNVLMDASSNSPRINMKNTSDYVVSAAITTNAGVNIQGYSSTVGDLGKFTLDGGTNAIIILTLGTTMDFGDAVIVSTATTGTGDTLLCNSGVVTVSRVVCHGARGSGIRVTAAVTLRECEVYESNKANSGSHAGIYLNSNGARAIRCFSHDNTSGSNCHGFTLQANGALVNVISDTNAGSGVNVFNATNAFLNHVDSYNNTGDGVIISNSTAIGIVIENSNLIKNGGWGINGTGAGARNGAVVNCGFGSGTQANSSGTTTGLKSMVESGTINYPANKTPWVDPANGDFRINLNEAINTGRGAFTQTQGGYAGTVGYPVIGAAQVAKVAPQVGMTGGMRG